MIGMKVFTAWLVGLMLLIAATTVCHEAIFAGPYLVGLVAPGMKLHEWQAFASYWGDVGCGALATWATIGILLVLALKGAAPESKFGLFVVLGVVSPLFFMVIGFFASRMIDDMDFPFVNNLVFDYSSGTYHPDSLLVDHIRMLRDAALFFVFSGLVGLVTVGGLVGLAEHVTAETIPPFQQLTAPSPSEALEAEPQPPPVNVFID